MTTQIGWKVDKALNVSIVSHQRYRIAVSTPIVSLLEILIKICHDCHLSRTPAADEM